MTEGQNGSSSQLDQQTELSKAGYRYLKEGKFQEAVESFKGILEINPQNNYGLVGLGEAARKQRKFDEAVNTTVPVWSSTPGTSLPWSAWLTATVHRVRTRKQSISGSSIWRRTIRTLRF